MIRNMRGTTSAAAATIRAVGAGQRQGSCDHAGGLRSRCPTAPQWAMQLSERASYAVRALIELAPSDGALVPAQQLATEQAMPGKSLEAVMTALRRAGLVLSQRGPDGGFSLAKPADEISLAEIVDVLRTF